MSKWPSYPLSINRSHVSIFVIWLVTISGMIGIWLGHGYWFLPKTPFNFILGVGLLLWNFPPIRGVKSWIVWTIVYLIGMGSEIVGVNTGLLFGDYHYGENLGLKLFGVPLLIGINWVVLSFLTATISHHLIPKKWLAILFGALLMVSLDFFIEPVAPIFDYWHWHEGFAPLRNFTDWLVVSFIMQVLVTNDIPKEKHSFPIHHFLSQVLFFIFFYAIYQF